MHFQLCYRFCPDKRLVNQLNSSGSSSCSPPWHPSNIHLWHWLCLYYLHPGMPISRLFRGRSPCDNTSSHQNCPTALAAGLVCPLLSAHAVPALLQQAVSPGFKPSSKYLISSPCVHLPSPNVMHAELVSSLLSVCTSCMILLASESTHTPFAIKSRRQSKWVTGNTHIFALCKMSNVSLKPLITEKRTAY